MSFLIQSNQYALQRLIFWTIRRLNIIVYNKVKWRTIVFGWLVIHQGPKRLKYPEQELRRAELRRFYVAVVYFYCIKWALWGYYSTLIMVFFNYSYLSITSKVRYVFIEYTSVNCLACFTVFLLFQYRIVIRSLLLCISCLLLYEVNVSQIIVIQTFRNPARICKFNDNN